MYYSILCAVCWYRWIYRYTVCTIVYCVLYADIDVYRYTVCTIVYCVLYADIDDILYVL